MKYLLYYLDGFVKKFPLPPHPFTIGREAGNDLLLDEDTFSRFHARVTPRGTEIVIEDMDSTNGVFVNQVRVREAVIGLGESFSLGNTEFILKEGSIQEFRPAKELVPIFRRIAGDGGDLLRQHETRYIQDIFNETLKHVLRSGMRQKNANQFLADLSTLLSNLALPGSFFIVSRSGGETNVLMAVKQKTGIMQVLTRLIGARPEIFERGIPFARCQAEAVSFFSEPLTIGDGPGAMLYITSEKAVKDPGKVDGFLQILGKELALVFQLFQEDLSPGSDLRRDGGGLPAEEIEPLDIVAGSSGMRDLIKQSRKIAKSDIFILIQGESGTGKELFARLIHRHSRRRDGKFVAINCAAIPENLLESELFGYEKGAFTGAYARAKGKLELASQGTLVLDEIGDMSLNLQAKLLRALQEYEFYRLGGTTPIKVDLRIISLTNSDIHRLVREKKIREDLYYRIAHHIISIPPLRERKEDIPVLVNHFISRFSRRMSKSFKGFSVRAYEALQIYDWPGNVRQLENEINRLLNLCDESELVSYDMISPAVRELRRGETDTAARTAADRPVGERDWVLRNLEENDWNKSKTARRLGMTYQGLHKKMKRLEIRRPDPEDGPR